MKPSTPKGTRDFLPVEMQRRIYIFQAIRSAFEASGFQNIETPAMENLDTLTGKYGDEGDKLIFKILNSGDYLAKADEAALQARDSAKLVASISEKALRYDLTVPFARFVVQHQNELVFPFKRYQIQPVWRADRPQKGRYREFYQCDADVVGSDSLLYELEFIQLFDRVLTRLNLPGFTIKLNNRKILSGIAEVTGEADKLVAMTVALDKLDKIGRDGVEAEMRTAGISDTAIEQLGTLLEPAGSNNERLEQLRSFLASSEKGLRGVEEVKFLIDQTQELRLERGILEFDVTLARGLNYYTGAIFEVKAHKTQIGSICGGGRYDDLTGIFGLPGLSGVGISFGADRIYDVMQEHNLFADAVKSGPHVLFANMGEKPALSCLSSIKVLHSQNITAEIYPQADKMKKQFRFAEQKGCTHLIIRGEEELNAQTFQVKNLSTGIQQEIAEDQLLNHFLA